MAEPTAPETKEPDAAGETFAAVTDPRPVAIVVYCSDPRFQNAFDQFIEKTLGLRKGEFVPLVVAGGAGTLASPLQLPKEFKFMKDRLELLREHFPSIRRVILINHEDCAYYKTIRDKVAGFLGRFVSSSSAHEDMPAVAAVFKSLLAHLGVSLELYYASFTDSTRSNVKFERISF